MYTEDQIKADIADATQALKKLQDELMEGHMEMSYTEVQKYHERINNLYRRIRQLHSLL